MVAHVPEDETVEDLIAKRRAANPRRSPDREPVGAEGAPRLIAVTAAVVVMATVVLVVVLLLD